MQLSKRSLTTLFAYSVKKYSTFGFLSYVDGPVLTYEQFGRTVLDLHGFLRKKGIRRGDRILLLGQNQPLWGVGYFAAVTYGAVIVPVLTDFHPDEILKIIAHSGAGGIIISERMMKKMKGRLPDHIWQVKMENLPHLSEKNRRTGFDQAEDAALIAELEEKTDEEDLAAVIYTSGTTGTPKGVMLSHKNIVQDVISTTFIAKRLRPGDHLLSILPLAHTYECTIGFLTPMLLGGHIFYLDALPAPSVLMPALKKVRPHVMLSVPLLMEKIYKNLVLPTMNGNAVLRSLYPLPVFRKLLHAMIGIRLRRIFGGRMKYFIIGGASPTEEVEQFLREARFPLAKGYGLTETAPLVAGATAGYARLYTIGPPIRDVRIRIDSPDPAGQAGEIQVKGDNVSRGYYRDEEKTRAAFTSDGWFRTGDLGTIDGDGYLSIRGRLKNLILGPSGENIYPESIEELLNEGDYVSESLVYEQEGRLVARVHLDYDKILARMKQIAGGAGEVSRIAGDASRLAGDLSRMAGEYLVSLKQSVNKRLNVFSRISEIFEQTEPFEKTPTNKIKRYIYTAAKKS